MFPLQRGLMQDIMRRNVCRCRWLTVTPGCSLLLLTCMCGFLLARLSATRRTAALRRLRMGRRVGTGFFRSQRLWCCVCGCSLMTNFRAVWSLVPISTRIKTTICLSSLSPQTRAISTTTWWVAMWTARMVWGGVAQREGLTSTWTGSVRSTLSI